jgi:hypothetical protein
VRQRFIGALELPHEVDATASNGWESVVHLVDMISVAEEMHLMTNARDRRNR